MRALTPTDLLHFVELRAFSEAWDRELGLSDDDLAALQILIMLGPKGAPVIAATGGLRKMRFAPPGWSKGKRGALRVCYMYYEAFGVVLLVTAYAKSRKDDLSSSEKKGIAALITEIEGFLLRRRGID